MIIVPHQFQATGISQLSEDMVIGDRLIPKGYVNATQMCKAGGKRWANYSRLDRSKAYLEALSSVTRI